MNEKAENLDAAYNEIADEIERLGELLIDLNQIENTTRVQTPVTQAAASLIEASEAIENIKEWSDLNESRKYAGKVPGLWVRK